mmetsp:Transcript_20813/g.39102  ORF Transcript_20813/g.39102 Transcript_20813/m.39102 type:complete len:208 (+) Transcript_20813:54-677(+)
MGSYLMAGSLRQHGQARKALEQQLRSFTIQEAMCHNPSDRRWVEKSVLRWFGSLEKCNQHIREGVSDRVLQAVGSEVYYPLSMLLPLCLISLFSDADYFAGGWFDEDTADRLAKLCGWSASVLTLVPLCHRICYKCCERQSSCLREAVVNIMLGILVAGMWMFAFTVNYHWLNFSEVGTWTVLIPILEWGLCVWVHRASCSWRCCRK